MIAKAEVVATPIPPVASDLPFGPEPISLFHRAERRKRHTLSASKKDRMKGYCCG